MPPCRLVLVELLTKKLRIVGKRLFLLFLGMGMAVSLAGQTFGEFYDCLESYQKKVELKRVKDENVGARLKAKTFDIGTYMDIFSELSVLSGRRIECVYWSGGTGGRPLLYGWEESCDRKEFVRQWREKVWADNMESLRELWERKQTPQKDRRQEKRASFKYFNKYLMEEDAMIAYASDSTNAPMRFLVPEDSEMGYFQLLMFDLYADNFALFWHAWYNYRFLICDKAQIEFLIQENREETFEVCFDEQKMLPLLETDVAPKVVMKQDGCVITIYAFYAGRGVCRETYSIPRKAPYSIAQENSDCLVENSFRGVY